MIKSNLAVLMAQRGLNITDLSKKTGISRNTISSLYNNHAQGIQFETLDVLCKYLQVSPNEILIYHHFDFEFINISQPSHDSYIFETIISINNNVMIGEIRFLIYDPMKLGDELSINIQFPKSIHEELLKLPLSFKSELDEALLHHVFGDDFKSKLHGTEIFLSVYTEK